MANSLTAKFTGTTPAAPGSAILGIIAPNPAFVAGATNQVDSLMSRYESMAILCTRQGATGGTLDIYVQISLDEGVTWTDIGHYTQLAAAAPSVTDLVTISRYQSTTTPQPTGDATYALAPFINGEYTNRLRFKAVAGAGTTAGSAYTIIVFLNNVTDG